MGLIVFKKRLTVLLKVYLVAIGTKQFDGCRILSKFNGCSWRRCSRSSWSNQYLRICILHFLCSLCLASSVAEGWTKLGKILHQQKFSTLQWNWQWADYIRALLDVYLWNGPCILEF